MTATSNDLRAAAAAAVVDQGRLRYPESLPITERREEIVDAIRTHQVVIVAGETGSGKSTQLPKLCLEAGRGVAGMIGHTQPRRVAARTIAERVADELGSKLGEDVGYTVRFTDQVGDGTLVKVMTDGILLAEIQRDRMLRRYDTLIIDEAHERSLNIDFILGYLKQLLPKRPDLKVIVTSATIDTDRFAQHFSDCPVIEVTGRTFPVEIRYRPFGPDAMSESDAEGPSDAPAQHAVRDERDQVQAIVDAVEELSREAPGDVLVFLSGEREIHDTADALRRLELRQTEVLPLYARLSSAEQHRIFERPATGGAGRRIVLATNVAETSLTVPGVRYVVDAGLARISRYSRRLKVQRLPIEPVSQASANQRSGRCGRVAPGICIRLYAQDDFETRPEFTEPEILRTNLASVILQMTAIGLGDVARFPFVEPPDHAAIRDGYQLLDELAAIRSAPDGGVGPRRLTKVGERLARLPVDPRLGRMVLEADRLGCVREVLVIASGLSIQDPRERPQDKREQAAEFHNRFRVDGSDLLGIVALWDHLREQQRALSGNQFRRMCRKEFLNYLRVREWMDLFSQLRRIAGQLGIRPTTEESHPDHVHQAVLSGLLSHLGMRDRETKQFIGARQSRFVIAPGSALTRRPPAWVMAAELVETNQLYARRVAKIDPKWAERASSHIHKRSHDNVRWDPKGGRAVATESVTLYGLPIVSDRTIGYDRVDHAEARAWFITKALVEREVTDTAWIGRQKFLAHNEEFLERIRRLAARVRRLEVVDDEMLFEFYDDRIGDDVTSVQHFDRWWKQERRSRPDVLDLTEEFVARTGRSHGVRLADYPDTWRQTVGDHTIELPLTYRYAPGEPLDGVTVHVPLAGLYQVRDVGFDWQIAGHRAEVVSTLVRSLPKPIRRQLIPLGDTVDVVVERMLSLPGDPPDGRLVDVLASTVTEVSGVAVAPTAFDTNALAAHLRLNIVVSDDDGTVHAVGTELDALRAGLAGTVRDSIAAAAPIEERRGIVDWDLGDLPRVVESKDRALDVRAYPTLLDVGDSVALRVVTTPELQQRSMRGGVRRLLLLNGAPTRSSVVRQLANDARLAIAAGPIELGELSGDCVAAAVDRVMSDHGVLPWTRDEFDELRRAVREQAPGLAANGLRRASRVVAAASEASALLARLHAEALRPSVDDANAHLGRLVHRGFVLGAGLDRLDDIERYVRGIVYRLERLAGAHDRDRRRMAEIVPLEQRYASIVDHAGAGRLAPDFVDVRWQLEDLRVATFAQPLSVKRPGQPSVSATRIANTLARV
ncbi:MAG: ATP-dependent RNA helicase HrpA [Ilumatobacteraceae bacterium]